MSTLFDFRGNLVPAGIKRVDLAFIEENFVHAFPESSQRAFLFGNFIRYNQQLIGVLRMPLRQWIDGSFITNKVNPKDVDVVTFVPSDVFEQYEKILRSDFASLILRDAEGIDGYFVREFPPTHPHCGLTQLDTAYWLELLGSTRRDANRRRHPKGIIELFFDPK